MTQPSIVILSAYHKPGPIYQNSIIQPIHVGRELAFRSQAEGGMEPRALKWMQKHMRGDDTGDNISEKNPYYSEVTAIYWAWKHYMELGNPDYIGLCHYRRFYAFNPLFGSHWQQDIHGMPQMLFNTIADEQKIRETVGEHDICVRSAWIQEKDVVEQYAAAHPLDTILNAFKIVECHYPEYIKSIELYMRSNKHYFCNMFIMRKELFFEYAAWLFDVLFALEPLISHHKQNHNVYNRLPGFVAERLTGLYIYHAIHERNLAVKEIPTVFVRSPYCNPLKRFKFYLMTLFRCQIYRKTKFRTS